MSETEPVPRHKMTVRLMIALIIMLLIGILTRWEYIKKEASESVKRYFTTEQPQPDSTDKK